MAIDLDAIRKKVEQLQSGGTTSVTWRPKPGEYDVRVIPWPNLPEGEVFLERDFYYNVSDRSILAPKQFGKPDPVFELQRKCWDDGSDEMKELAKQLYPRTRTYAAIVVRGEEGEGVRLWGFGRTTHQELLELFLDEDTGDWTDLKKGLDLRVTIEQKPGTSFFITKVKIPRSRKPSPLTTDAKQLKEWLKSLPDLDEIYQLKTYDEIVEQVNAWFASNTGDAEEINTSASEPESAPRARKPEPAQEAVTGEGNDDTVAKATQDIDAVLAELEGEDG